MSTINKGKELITEIIDSAAISASSVSKLRITIYDAGNGCFNFWVKYFGQNNLDLPIKRNVNIGISLPKLFEKLKNAQQSIEKDANAALKIRKSFHISGFMGFPQLPEKTIRITVRLNDNYWPY